MATKKTLADLKKCPIDFIYLWASDSFISRLGSKGKIIRQKKYYQYQTLWKTMAENETFDTSEEGQTKYNDWANEIAKAIKSTYNISPGDILVQLAMGKEVLGKNWSAGVYGIGTAEDPQSFSQNSEVTVNATTGLIMGSDGTQLSGQTPIYGADGNIAGYSVLYNGAQYQSVKSGDSYVAYAYSTDSGVQYANGTLYDATKGSFWQNADNYMPIVDKILSWVSSIVSLLFPDRTVLTTQNTVPKQTEWIENESDSGNTWLIAGGVVVAGLLLTMANPFSGDKKKKSKKNK